MSDSDPEDPELVDVEYVEEEPAPAALPAAGEEIPLQEPAEISQARWEEEAIAEHLQMVGSIAHELWGKAESDWLMSERDLQRIGPPLTRILNRYEPTARAAIASDPLLLGYGTTMYAYRSVLQARAAAAAAAEAEREQQPEMAGYERMPSQERPRENRGVSLRFPEAAREADEHAGE